MLGLWISLNGLFWGTLCSLKAKEKNRNTKNWFLLGFIFSPIAYLTIVVLHKLSDSIDNETDPIESFAASTLY